MAIININGIASRARIMMLGEFLRRHDVDFALLQEVAHTNINNLRGYQVYDKIGTTGRGTAILTKVGLNLYGIKRLPTERGISAYYNNTYILNIYAPSGAENRAERAMFYNTDIIDLMPHTTNEILKAGDFKL